VGPKSIEIDQPFDEFIGTSCGEAGRILENSRDFLAGSTPKAIGVAYLEPIGLIFVGVISGR
jgi:hypothetical protein